MIGVPDLSVFIQSVPLICFHSVETKKSGNTVFNLSNQLNLMVNYLFFLLFSPPY
jgi:hypothetical protein